jgi:hypothetical protein
VAERRSRPAVQAFLAALVNPAVLEALRALGFKPAAEARP